MKLKRLLAVVLVGTMAASMASGAAVSAEEKQKLVIWSWGADEEKKAREDAVAIFQENHPEIEVEHSVIPTADHAWDQKAAAALAAGTGPDVSRCPRTTTDCIPTTLKICSRTWKKKA